MPSNRVYITREAGGVACTDKAAKPLILIPDRTGSGKRK